MGLGMSDIRFGRVRLQRAEGPGRSATPSDDELRRIEWELRGILDDPMRMRGLARFLDTTIFGGSEHLLELLLDRVRSGRIELLREADPEVEPTAGLDAQTLARFAEAEDLLAEHAIRISLIGADGAPIAGARYRIELPEGRVVEGCTGPDGSALVWGLTEPGNCKVGFPDLDADAWEPVSSVPLG